MIQIKESEKYINLVPGNTEYLAAFIWAVQWSSTLKQWSQDVAICIKFGTFKVVYETAFYLVSASKHCLNTIHVETLNHESETTEIGAL